LANNKNTLASPNWVKTTPLMLSIFWFFAGVFLSVSFLTGTAFSANEVQKSLIPTNSHKSPLINSLQNPNKIIEAPPGRKINSNNNDRYNSRINDFNPGEIVIHWTAPGDDGHWGRATGYDLRYLPQYLGPIDTEEKWMSAIRVNLEPRPSIHGRIDSMVVTGVGYGMGYYFSLRAFDDASNYSSLSNSPLLISGDTAHGEIIPGDANNSGAVNGVDIIYLIGYMEGTNPQPVPFLSGDANGDCNVNGLDVIYLMNFFKGSGGFPVLGDCKYTP
jgi:hypothetical protein